MAKRNSVRRAVAPLSAPPRERNPCLELMDQSSLDFPAADLFGLPRGPDSAPTLARLAEQFIKSNHAQLSRFDVRLGHRFDGSQVYLSLSTGNQVGAIPLQSPTTARHDYGLVVQPRFPWVGLGPMLAVMGWRIAPQPLRLPLLRRSERRVPAWVLSSMVLTRMHALLRSLTRRFEDTHEDRTAPRGRVDWEAYARTRIPHGRLMALPCTFPDLRDDRSLLSAIRYTVERHYNALHGQRVHGAFVNSLIELARDLLSELRGVAAVAPGSAQRHAWTHRALLPKPFREGIQAIDWTVDDRGLAGLSDLEGIPWVMPMERFFEAWVETQFARLARRTGGTLRSGRKHETVRHLEWQPSIAGSQRALIPDLCIVWEDLTLIVDAKYKRHWEDLQETGWRYASSDLRDSHRHDLLQVLAYANLAQTSRVVVCLVYPCELSHWNDLHLRGRAIQSADVPGASRPTSIWLTALPMTGVEGDTLAALEQRIQGLLR